MYVKVRTVQSGVVLEKSLLRNLALGRPLGQDGRVEGRLTDHNFNLGINLGFGNMSVEYLKHIYVIRAMFHELLYHPYYSHRGIPECRR